MTDADNRATISLPAGMRGSTAFALALGTFMQVLDTTIANVSLPTIAGNVGVSANQGTWIITSFAVSNGICVPLTGWLMQRYGVVRTFVTSVALFTLASFLCGIAWSFESLIAFRVMQGAVSGPMIPGSQALLLSIFPATKRGTALAIWSMTTLIAPIMGPLLGGYISDHYNWPWIFLINVPIGILSAGVCWQALHRSETPTRKLPIDSVGMGLLVVWVGALQIMLDTGKDEGWFDSTQIVVLGLVALIGFAAFVIWELYEEHPVVDLSFFRMRNFSVGVFLTCVGYAVFFANIVILPLWLQTQLGYTATWAGLALAPAGLVALAVSPFVGRNLARYDARWFATIAFLMLGTDYYLLSLLNAHAAFGDFRPPIIAQGVGMGFFFVSVLALQLDRIPPQQVPAATGLGNFMRITSGAFATSIVTTIWDNRATLHQTRLAEASNLYSPALQGSMDALQGAGLGHDQTLGALTHELLGQAYMLSSLDVFRTSMWIVLMLVPLAWLARRPVVASGMSAAAE